MSSPKSLAESTEFSAKLPPGNEERFSGYGVMGLPFAIGGMILTVAFLSKSKLDHFARNAR